MFRHQSFCFQPQLTFSFVIVLSITTWLDAPSTAPSSRSLLTRKRLLQSATDLQVPDILPEFELGKGPWITDKVLLSEWRRSSQCNPHSGRCSCLREWGVNINECVENITHNLAILEASGWMTDWPYLPGLHRCSRSMCKVRHPEHTRDCSLSLMLQSRKLMQMAQ
jgi:hypothetical protein